MGYLIFRGVSTESLPNVYVSRMPSHKKASMRFTEYYVKGRDGALHVDEGFSNYDIGVKLALINATAYTRQLVNAWADGTGKLITSDDLTLAYRATVKDEIQWERVKANAGYYDMASIVFNCQPGMYEAVDSQITVTETGTIVNPGSATAFPLIQVNGSGDCVFTINGTEISISGVSDPVYIDCETGYVYTASGAATMTGDFPELGLGTNAIGITSGVSSLVITPHWRWV